MNKASNITSPSRSATAAIQPSRRAFLAGALAASVPAIAAASQEVLPDTLDQHLAGMTDEQRAGWHARQCIALMEGVRPSIERVWAIFTDDHDDGGRPQIVLVAPFKTGEV